MKIRLLFALSLLGVALGAAVPAHADRGGSHHDGGHHGDWHHYGHSRIGFYFGGPLWWDPYPYPYYYRPYYYSQPIVIQQTPPVYVQKPPEPVQPSYWYYCPGVGYYPYVPSCTRPWMQVLPQPAQ